MTAKHFSSPLPEKNTLSMTRRTALPERHFADALHTLLFHTELLAGKAISCYMQLANRQPWVSDATLFSNFSVELKEQCSTLREAIKSNATGSTIRHNIGDAFSGPNKPDSAEMERERLIAQTEQLMDLYARLQPHTVLRSDRSQSFYLLAQHLAALNEHLSLLAG